MDLDGFEEVESIAGTAQQGGSEVDAAECLKLLDEVWYSRASRAARWLDLIGDYAGEELFIIDGNSLIQNVLDNPNLRLGRVHDNTSFQLLHALYLFETQIEAFQRRNAVFEVVFWTSQIHLASQTGDPRPVVASRHLAYLLLRKHVERLHVPTHVFQSTSDPLWIEYQAIKKPMFVMMNDGGSYTGKTISKEEADAGVDIWGTRRALLQRVLMFQMLASGMAVAMLKDSQFREFKILVFLIEQRHLPTLDMLSASIRKPIVVAQQVLDDEIAALSVQHAYPDSVVFFNSSIDEVLIALGRKYLGRSSGCSPFPELLYLFLAHILFLQSIPLSARGRRQDGIRSTVVGDLFLPDVFLDIAAMIPRVSNDIFFDIDGRIFMALVASAARQPLLGLVGRELRDRVDCIWSQASSLSPPYEFSLLTSYLATSTPNHAVYANASNDVPSRALLPFNNPILNSELSLIHVITEEVGEPPQTGVGFGTLAFRDQTHWHNNKSILPPHLGGTGDKQIMAKLDEQAQRRKLRSDQRFMATMTKHAESLGVGKQITIPSVKTAPRKSAIEKPSVQHKSKAKEKKPTKKEQLLLDIKQRTDTKKSTESGEWWQQKLSEMQKTETSQQLSTIPDLLRSSHSQTALLHNEIQTYYLHLQFKSWAEEGDVASSILRDKKATMILRTIQKICSIGQITQEIHAYLAAALRALGFGNYLSSIPDPLSDSDAGQHLPLGFKPIKLHSTRDGTAKYPYMKIIESPVIWQLRVFGNFMDRSMDSAADTRVSFQADAWQRQVLDAIDNDESILVVAPTSAGKTFISFYAMEKILKTSDDDIIVYVAPNKALVTQVAAEVCARFRKNLDIKSCWSVHTRDYRIHDPQNCQILITVPEMLGIMLLSPPLAQKWTPRIKRIILDEIHTISQQEGGAVWEQIISLAPCPIIGLSATIGSPEAFNTWLESVQLAHGYQHRLIHHPTRYSHLRKHTYMISPVSDDFQGLVAHPNTSRTKFIHPLAALSPDEVTNTIPDDLALEASDTLSLWTRLNSRAPNNERVLSLHPDVFFANQRLFLKQRDIIFYEKALKDVVSDLISSQSLRDAPSSRHQIISDLRDIGMSHSDAMLLATQPSTRLFLDNLLPFAADLHVSDDLPAIFFSFDRSYCDIMGKTLLEDLEVAEEKWRKTSPEWQRHLLAHEHRLRNAERLARQRERAKKEKKDSDDHRDETREPQSSFDPERPSPAFSFAGIKTTYSISELDKDIAELSKWSATPAWLLRALRRGVAVHHAGQNKKYRSLVESLFRQKYIRIMIATGTLALGINAPAKSSVFCGDSPFLTALMYRQCAGRAGRRGFDLLGKVIFYGVPIDRVHRLMMSKLPSLSGAMPLTSTLTLRLLSLLENSEHAPFATSAIQSIVSLPHMSFSSDIGRHQILHHIRFNIEYLRRRGMLDEVGTPLNFAGLASHLYHHEPSNFALVELFRKGVLHRISNQASRLDAQSDFIILMAHLFGRRNLHSAYGSKGNIRQVIKDLKSPSIVLLPKLPDDARRALIDHDKETLSIFTAYAVAFASQYKDELVGGEELPLSKISFAKQVNAEKQSPFTQFLADTAIKPIARSLFVANSGHDDHFASVQDLARTGRRGVHLSEYAIPSLQHITDEVDDDEHPPLNGYIYDFFKHGQLQPLVDANGIRRGEVWYLLQDFVLALLSIRAALREMMTSASSNAADPQSFLNDDGLDQVDPGEMDMDPEDEDEQGFRVQWEFPTAIGKSI